MHRALMHKGQDPIPACGAKDRAHIFTTLHLGLDLIPHVPGTGPNPRFHYLAHSTRTRRLTTGPVKHCGSPVYSRRVCVCKRLDMAIDRMQGAWPLLTTMSNEAL